MKLKSFKTLAVLLICAVSAFAGTFTSTAGRFSADFIAAPTAETETAKLADGTGVTIYEFFAIASDKTMAENLSYVDLPRVVSIDELKDTAKAAYNGTGRTLDGIGTTESDGRTWVLAAGHDDAVLYFYANTQVGKRLYEVIIAQPLKTATHENEQKAEDFLGSVRITE
jgi:hypothetical protein